MLFQKKKYLIILMIQILLNLLNRIYLHLLTFLISKHQIKKEFDNVKKNFLYNVHLKFNSYKGDPSSLSKIISKTNNEAKESIKSTVSKIKSFIESLQKVNGGCLPNTLSELNEFKIAKNKAKSLLCCLVIIKNEGEF